MKRILRALWDGLLTHCPQCHQGRMFAAAFTMRGSCPVCGLPFERAAGEITGGMGINAFVTQTLVFVLGAGFGLLTSIPLLPLLGSLVLVAIVFPIAFYRPSRGLWASCIYLTGDNDEPDEAPYDK